jgi:hypothetical protein
MATLTWKDNRLAADDVAPWDTTVMLTGPRIPLSELVADSIRWGDDHEGGARDLMIYCHGAAGYLQLCKEGVAAWNLSKLAPLKPYFDGVSIHACEVAKGPSGRAFCVKLALTLYAPVTAAVGLQGNTGPQTLYGWLDDRKYDGDYYIHNPSGARTGPLRSR